MKLVTIGGYGFTEGSFREQLVAAGVEVFVDIRQRRSMRGARYAFLNARHLERLIAELGIAYLHLRTLAPTDLVRKLQKSADARLGVQKTQRKELALEFRDAYIKQIATAPRALAPTIDLLNAKRTIALFCVERDPNACHRSLVASMLCKEVAALTVEHLQDESHNCSENAHVWNKALHRRSD